MKNIKSILYEIFSDKRITDLFGDEILDAYPNCVEKFPCLIYLDSNQTDIEFADNQPLVNLCSVEIHIFTKALDGYPTSTELGLVINEVMAENYFSATLNMEVPDVVDDVRHRVMNFRNYIF